VKHRNYTSNPASRSCLETIPFPHCGNHVRSRLVAHTSAVSATAIASAAKARSRVLHVLAFTLIWMSVEATISLAAAWRAHSPALLAFGGDSAIELLSAAVVFWGFHTVNAGARNEPLAARIAGSLLFALAAYVVVVSALALLGLREAKSSLLGIAVLLAAAVIMPLLARQKRRLSAMTASAALRADAAESALCGYMSGIALAGLVVNAHWRIPWADPVAALCLVPFILREGQQTLRGKPCDCC
jgi:divalent metal cation (Fe/Co/Zn/Cd) transporter